MAEPLSLEELEERLEAHVCAVLSSRRTAVRPARGLAELAASEQDRVLEWVGRIAGTSAELAFQFAEHAPETLGRLGPDRVPGWALAALDAYDRAGLFPAAAVLRDPEGATGTGGAAGGVALPEVAGVLQAFLRGLHGRPLRVAGAEEAHTDTETVYLPPIQFRLAERRDNFLLYKATAAHLWAQARFGTFRDDLLERLAAFPDAERARRGFLALEAERLDARLERELPGLSREMAALRRRLDVPAPAGWAELIAGLAEPDADAGDSLERLSDAYGQGLAEPPCYAGALYAEQALAVKRDRQERELRQVRVALSELARQQMEESGEEPPAGEEGDTQGPGRFRVREVSEGEDVELLLDEQPVAAPPDARSVLASVAQDFQGIPPEALVPAGPGPYHVSARDGEDSGCRTDAPEGAWLYPEWDHRRGDYRKQWCALREEAVTPRYDGFVERTLARRSGLARRLRRRFEALRGGDRRLRRQPEGDEVDLDAFVAATAGALAGAELNGGLYTRRRRVERDVAALFLVDASGSTEGWVNEAERESLALLTHALEALGDRYGIYGFSGTTRSRGEVYPVKDLAEPFSPEVAARIAGLAANDYTRMGAAIRHVTDLLADVPTRTRLLVVLSDGKPDDFDGYYRGTYGIEDTRQALIEARGRGIHPFCVTLDREGLDYLPRLFGAAGFVAVTDVSQLPRKMGEMYRRLTT